MIGRRQFIAGALSFGAASLVGNGVDAQDSVDVDRFVVTNSGSDSVSFIDLATGSIEELTVGVAPWGISSAKAERAYIATANGVTEIDTAERRLLSETPYRSWNGESGFGEYRPGGMGIAVSPDGTHVFTGVYLPEGPSLVEVMNAGSKRVEAVVTVGYRPFQLLSSRDGASVYAVNHDSYSVTVIDTADLSTRTLETSPLGDVNGLAGFEKPHYAALAEDGDLLLPFQGQVLLRLNPVTGESTTTSLSADTHQHGIAMSPDGRKIAIVGTGAAGGATGGPSLTILDTERSVEHVIPLERPHENAIWSADGTRVILTGGYTFGGGGWNGITLVNVDTEDGREIEFGALPLDIIRI